MLKEQETVFFAFRNMLTHTQWLLLKAIAKEGKVYQLTSKDFINKHQLGSSSIVLRSLKTLTEYDLIYSEIDPDDQKFYSVYDVLFQRWCENK